MSNDPVGFLGHLNGTQGVQGFNRYAYVNNNPYGSIDPDGKACVPCVTGAIGAVVGGISGGITQVATDLISGKDLSLASTVGAIAGGAVSGGIIGATGNIAAGVTAGAATQSATSQLISTGKVDGTKLVADTAVGATLGKIPGAKVLRVTSGRGSMVHVMKTQTSRLANGTANNMSVKTLAKGVTAEVVGGSLSSAAGIVSDALKVSETVDQGFENIKDAVCRLEEGC